MYWPLIGGFIAFVLIAVLLGWLLLREPVTARTFLAMALIIGAVVWIQFSHKIGRTVGPPKGRVDTVPVRQGASEHA